VVGKMTIRFLLLVILQLLNSRLSSGFFLKFLSSPFKQKVIPPEIIPVVVNIEPEVIIPVIDPIEKNDLKLGVLLLNLGGPQSQKVSNLALNIYIYVYIKTYYIFMVHTYM